MKLKLEQLKLEDTFWTMLDNKPTELIITNIITDEKLGKPTKIQKYALKLGTNDGYIMLFETRIMYSTKKELIDSL